MNLFTTRDSFLTILFISVTATLFSYQYLGFPQYEMLWIILRAMDPSYLVNDLFVNSSANFNEDYFFAHFIILLQKVIELPVLFFVLTLLINIAQGWTAFLLGKHLFNGNKFAGIVGALLVISVSSMAIGYGPFLMRNDLIPSHLIRPLLFYALLMGLKDKPVQVSILAGIASFIHPLEGPVTGFLLLGMLFIQKLLNKERTISEYRPILYGVLILCACTAIFVVPYYLQQTNGLSDELFIEIMLFRFPNHYLPSYFFKPKLVIMALGFLITCVLSIRIWLRNSTTDKKMVQSIFIISSLLLILCLGGYLFVEVLPQRIWVIAHPFRFLYIIKLFGLLLIGGVLAEMIQKPTNKWTGWILFFSTIQLWATACLLLLKGFEDKLKKTSLIKGLLSHPLLQGLLVVILIYFLPGFIRKFTLVFFFCIVLLWVFVYWKKRIYYGLLLLSVLAILVNIFIVPQVELPEAIASRSEKYFRPKVYQTDEKFKESGVAAFIKENTPESSVLIVPAGKGSLRLLANRALVVDLIGIPMEDKGLIEWYSRLKNVYSLPKDVPLGIKDNYNFGVFKPEDSLLIKLSSLYNASYAVVDKQKNTELEVLYEDNHFKLIDLSN